MIYLIFLTLCLIIFNLTKISQVGLKAFKTKQLRLKTAEIRSKRIPFQKESGEEHILVIGDSTMHGYGAEKPDNTIGGLLAKKYSDSSIETLAKNGARLRDMDEQLKLAKYSHYKLIFMGIGGNDVLRMTSFNKIQRDLNQFLSSASNITELIVLVHSVNMGNTGVFAFPLNYFYDYRTRKLSKIYNQVAAKHQNVRYVSFYRPIGNDFYNSKTRPKFIASDGFHPSDYANKFFFTLTEEFLP